MIKFLLFITIMIIYTNAQGGNFLVSARNGGLAVEGNWNRGVLSFALQNSANSNYNVEIWSRNARFMNSPWRQLSKAVPGQRVVFQTNSCSASIWQTMAFNFTAPGTNFNDVVVDIGCFGGEFPN